MSKIITWEQFPWEWMSKIKPERRKKANIGTWQGRRYLNLTTAFDIETTGLPDREESCLYIWQWQFDESFTVMGRTWDELRCLLAGLKEVVPADRTLVILVHNLSY